MNQNNLKLRLLFKRFYNLNNFKYFSLIQKEQQKGRESLINIPQNNNQNNNNNNNNNNQIDLNPPRGTRDFFPDEQRLKLWIFDKWRTSAKIYGFEEYDAPVVENEELYLRKGGEEISQQLYNFTDKSGRKLCLRPEMTPSLARMILSKGSKLNFPLRWFSIPQCWRYERMAKGRRREHYQWNMDIWGIDTVHAEAELLSSITNTLKSMGLTENDVVIKINSRKLIISILNNCDIPEDLHISACVIIDKLDKLPPKDVIQELSSIGISPESTTKLISLLKLSKIEEFTEVLKDCEGLNDLMLLFQLLNSYGIQNWVQFDSKVVRGLAYYTGIVFECFDRQGEFRAICGGGRYDKLLSTYTNPFEGNSSSIPAVGFGFGDAVIVELLRHKNLLPYFSQLKEIDILIGTTDSDPILYERSIKTACELREVGYKVELMLQTKRFKSILQNANRNNINHIIVFSLHEMGDEPIPKALIKSLIDGSQKIVYDSEIRQNIQEIIKK